MAVTFELIAQDPHTHARRGRLHTPHGVVDTPVFMPVGTQATVKGLTAPMLAEAGVKMLLGNTYHLHLRPGEDVVAKLGGLHSFMRWDGAILTDSGGFQVFSLADINAIDDAGVTFKSHLDGSLRRLDPAIATRIQNQLGADVIMAFDQCPPSQAPAEQVRAAVERSVRWAAQCQQAHARPHDQALFGIVQGGLDVSLRLACLDELAQMDLPGYAIGGLAVGESHDQMVDVLAKTVPAMPRHKPRYLMGVGTPRDLLRAVAYGVDMFDCVMPTRNGRNGLAFTDDGPIRLRNAKWAQDPTPLDGDSPLDASQHSRAYLRHLFQAEEMLGPILASQHNVAHYQRLMARARQAIEAGGYAEFMRQALARLGEAGPAQA